MHVISHWYHFHCQELLRVQQTLSINSSQSNNHSWSHSQRHRDKPNICTRKAYWRYKLLPKWVLRHVALLHGSIDWNVHAFDMIVYNWWRRAALLNQKDTQENEMRWLFIRKMCYYNLSMHVKDIRWLMWSHLRMLLSYFRYPLSRRYDSFTPIDSYDSI